MKRVFKQTPEVVFYCADYLDYIIWKPIRKYFPEIPIIAKNKAVQNELAKYNIQSALWPEYPKAVIMARHALHKFPCDSIVKIGMRHGPYHFKKFIGKEKYNAFDLFLLTSTDEVECAKRIGITSAQGPGFPKIDPMFDGTISEEEIKNLRKDCGFDERPVIMFSATWEESGMSAVRKWYDKLEVLAKDYNILVTVHPWTNEEIKSKIRETEGVCFIEDKNILPYLMLSDLLIGDTSSIIAEFSALNKPIITFEVNSAKRLEMKIVKMLEEISERVKSFDELSEVIKDSLVNSDKRASARERYNAIMFDELDGKAGKRASEAIKAILAGKNIII